MTEPEATTIARWKTKTTRWLHEARWCAVRGWHVWNTGMPA